MKSGKASSTAQAAAAMRALESLLAEERRLFEDPFARKFLSGWMGVLVGMCRVFRGLRDPLERALDRRFPGVPADFICRTRFIDHAILAMDRERKIERLVIFGAGYDTRALRLPLSQELQIIEIDHPATQASKARIASRWMAADLSNRLRWIAHDLTQAPESSPGLRAALEGRARTFWIAEGLLSYLPRESVTSLFAWISSKSAPGSRVALTYGERALVEKRSADPAAQAINRYLARVGEPFLSGWTPEEMARQCLDAGFAVEEDISEAELAKRYLAPLGRDLCSVKEFRILLGRAR